MAKNLILALSMFLIIGLSSFKKDKHKPESKLDLYATITGRSIVDGRVRLAHIAVLDASNVKVCVFRKIISSVFSQGGTGLKFLLQV